MRHVAATKFKEHYGAYLEEALLEPLVIQKHKRNSLVVLSYTRFHELEEIQEAFNDMILKLQMDQIKDVSEYLEGEKSTQRLKAYTS